VTDHRDAKRPPTRRACVPKLVAAVLLLLFAAMPALQAQSFLRTPSLGIGPRITPITPATSGVTARISPNLAGSVGRGAGDVHFSHNNFPSCDPAHRAASGECLAKPTVTDSGGAAGSGGGAGRGPSRTPRRDNLQARRHRLARIDAQDFPLIGSTVGLYGITDGRSVERVRAELAIDASVRSAQPNFRYLLQDQPSVQAPSEGDPAQYALAKLRLPQAHTLAHGDNITVAVIDSGIDVAHPELAGAIVDRFDALGSKEGPGLHGTGVAGAIVAHGRLMGGAPAAKILAIRAFGVVPSGAQSTSFVILKSLDYAAAHEARIINMSFAGPKDPLLERAVAAAATKGIVLVAASGNAGPKSPPLYPAANPNVIAVSATDAEDKLFAASNRGAQIAIAAPGADIFLPAPDGKYQMASGTSFSAAYVSGIAALVLQRNPALKPEQLRTILTSTARDLGAPGRDDLFGAGEADAFAAVSAVQAGSVPVADAPPQPLPETQKVSAVPALPPTRALNQPAATVASDKPAAP
jgi:hypothetical protein